MYNLGDETVMAWPRGMYLVRLVYLNKEVATEVVMVIWLLLMIGRGAGLFSGLFFGIMKIDNR